jgi:hypothetical protein
MASDILDTAVDVLEEVSRRELLLLGHIATLLRRPATALHENPEAWLAAWQVAGERFARLELNVRAEIHRFLADGIDTIGVADHGD